jgi:tight adherence protein C
MPPDLLLPLLASLLMGAGAFWAAWWVVRALASEDLEQGDQWRYDVSRINELRRLDVTYRLFQPLVMLLARMNRSGLAAMLPGVGRHLQAAGLPRFWLPEEYLAKSQLHALLLSPLYLLVCLRYFDAPGILLAIVLTGATMVFLRYRLATRARYRVLLIKRRLPFLLDLLTLLMEAGSSFLNALDQGVGELQGHPVATEFGRVLSDISMGKTRTQSFQAMRDRLGDDEIGSIIGSIIQSEDLGNPLAKIFRTQSDVLRIKRTQRAETVAGEAGVNMLLPGILVMMSTVLIIFGPFVINFLYSGFSL